MMLVLSHIPTLLVFGLLVCFSNIFAALPLLWFLGGLLFYFFINNLVGRYGLDG